MSDFTFESGPHYVGNGKPADFDQTTVKNEPMLFSADADFAWKHAGPITDWFLACIMPVCAKAGVAQRDVIIDTRVHMLMPGWFPCIPGWHLDDVPRTRPDGQPDHKNPAYRAQHFMALIGDASLTEFAIGTIRLNDVPVGSGRVIYGEWNDAIDKMLAAGDITTHSAKPGHIISFGDQDFHRGTPAAKSGWRWFGRASINTHRKATNEIRNQVQVYMPVPNAGW